MKAMTTKKTISFMLGILFSALFAIMLASCGQIAENSDEQTVTITLPNLSNGSSRSISRDDIGRLHGNTVKYRVIFQTSGGTTVVREGTGGTFSASFATGVEISVTVECLNASDEVIVRTVAKTLKVGAGENSLSFNLSQDGTEVIPESRKGRVIYTYGEAATAGTTSGLPTDNNTYNVGDTFTVENANMTWQHGQFTGWKSNVILTPDGGGQDTDAPIGGSSYEMPEGGVVLSAQWQKKTYKITYYGNSPSAAANVIWGNDNPTSNPTEVQALSSTTVSNAQPQNITTTDKNYKFTGWNTNANGNGTSYSSGVTIPQMTENLELYAQWSEKNLYTIMFADDPNGPTSDSLPNTISNVEQGQTSTSWTNPTATGYRFNGWKITDTDTSAVINANAGTITSYAPSQNVTLTAVWTVQTYTINYSVNGGQITQRNTESFTINDSITFSVATRAGYTFTNWVYTDDQNTPAVTTTAALIAKAGNGTTVSLTAQWQEMDTLYVGGDNADDTNGDGSTDKPFATIGKAITVIKTLSGTSKTIQLKDSITATSQIAFNASGKTITLTSSDNNIKIQRGNGLTAALISVSQGTLELGTVIIDGNKGAVTNATSALVQITGGTVTVGANAKIQNNKNSNGNGGGVSISNGTLNIAGIITDNEVEGSPTAGTGRGGGVYASSGTVNFNNGTVSNNKAADNAGGLWIYTNATLTGSGTVTGNSITNSSGSGGGIYFSGSELTLTDFTITRNTSTGGGGGVYMGTGSSTFNLDGSTNISNNTASNGGGIFMNGGNGIINVNSANVIVQNNTCVGTGAGLKNGIAGTNVTINTNGNTNIQDD